MKVIVIEPVERFLKKLGEPARTDIRRLQYLLQDYGHTLSMPYVKPIGHGLWELRRTGRPQIRILYGFCHGDALLLVALKKQRSAIGQSHLDLAHKRLTKYCA